MAYGKEVRETLPNLLESAELENVLANYMLADYYRTGAWGLHEEVENRNHALWWYENVPKVMFTSNHTNKRGNYTRLLQKRRDVVVTQTLAFSVASA